MKQSIKRYALSLCLSSSCLLVGCATHLPKNPQDPFEPYNRVMFKFNYKTDRLFIRPVAHLYTKTVPAPIQGSLTNLVDNVDTIPTIANDLLQFDMGHAVVDAMRLAINTTFGFCGVMDIAERLGLQKHRNDFGLTLAKWGYRKTQYFVIPLLGPSTVRDALALIPNGYAFTIWPYINPKGLRYSLLLASYVPLRVKFLPADRLVDAAFDPYIFVRNAYLQIRKRELDQVLARR